MKWKKKKMLIRIKTNGKRQLILTTLFFPPFFPPVSKVRNLVQSDDWHD